MSRRGKAPSGRMPYDEDPARTDDGPAYAYPWWFRPIPALFFLYHAVVLLAYNLPAKPPAHAVRRLADRYLGMHTYMRHMGLTQGWGMFAPNPHRANGFMRVYVEDHDGQVYDVRHDVYLRRRYPYLFYDRLAKINRRLIESAGYRRPYAAFVCRSWALRHGGRPPKRVWFEHLWTRVPPPHKVFRFMYYRSEDLHLDRRRKESFDCAYVVHGQLPPYLRRRYGFEPSGPPFRDVHRPGRRAAVGTEDET